MLHDRGGEAMALVSFGNVGRGLLHVLLFVARVAACVEVPFGLSLLASFVIRDLPWYGLATTSLCTRSWWLSMMVCRADTFRNDDFGQRAIAGATVGIAAVAGLASVLLTKMVRLF
jgi:hypothetical protein